MRENHAGGMPREPGDVLCGREIDARFLVQLHQCMSEFQFNAMARKQWNDVVAKYFGAISTMLNSIPHLRHHDLDRFAVDRVAINLVARKAFVNNAMPLHKFKQTILRNHILVQKNDNIAQIIHAVIQDTTDIAFRFSDFVTHANIGSSGTSSSIHASVQDFAMELFNLKSYANSELALIHNDFNSTPSKLAFFHMFDFKLINILKPFTHSFDDTRFPLFTHVTYLRR
jgi:hypothetical protein